VRGSFDDTVIRPKPGQAGWLAAVAGLAYRRRRCRV